MRIEITVENAAGDVIHHRVGCIGAKSPRAIKAAYSRLTNRLQRIYVDQWHRINIKELIDPSNIYHTSGWQMRATK